MELIEGTSLDQVIRQLRQLPTDMPAPPAAPGASTFTATGPHDATTRDRVMRLWIRAEVLRLTNIRASQNRSQGTPGPEGSIGKMAMAEVHKDISECAVDLLGAAGTLFPAGYPMARPETTALWSNPQQAFLRSRANSIEGGTTEIMKNILAERVLDLPGDVRVDKDKPWIDMSTTGDAAPRRRGRPPDRRSDETLARILRAARDRFSKVGYAQTSMADIAEAAGVTPRAIYHYADSKPRLFALAAEQAYQRFGAEIVARVLTQDDTAARLRGYVDVFRTLYQDDPGIVAFVIRSGGASWRPGSSRRARLRCSRCSGPA